MVTIQKVGQYSIAYTATVRGADIMAKEIRSKTKEVIKAGAQEVKTVAADALGAAGVAATGVVLDRVAEGMNTGAEKVEGAKPKLQKAIQTAVAPRRRQRANKTAARRSRKTKTVKKAKPQMARKKR